MKLSDEINDDVFRIDDYKIVSSKNLVVRDGVSKPITPKMLAVLRALAAKSGVTVSKDELMSVVWGNTVTSDMVLSRAISDLRKVFGDSGKQQAFIQTISKQGYALCRPVNWGEELTDVANERQTSWKTKWYGVAIVAVILFFYWYFSFFNNSDSVEFSIAPKLENITADIPSQRYTRFSRNGEKIAYLERTQDKSKTEIFVRHLQDSSSISVKKYSDNPALITVNFSFSPIGNQLAIKEMYTDNCKIIILNLQTREEKHLKTCPNSPIASIDWSPKRNEIVVTNYEPESQNVGLSIIDIDSSEVKPLVYPSQRAYAYLFPRFSPSGDSIAIVTVQARLDNWGVAVVDTATGLISKLVATEEKINQVVWHQSEKSIFYVLHTGAKPGIWHYDISTDTSKHIHNIDRKIRDLDYSLKTNQFSYIQEVYQLNIWKKSKSSSGNINDFRISLPTYQNHSPLLSPDEKFLAYFSSGRGEDELVIFDLRDRTIKLKFSQDSMKLIHARWSPDGRRILLTVANDEKNSLLNLDINSGNSEKIEAEEGVSLGRGEWSKLSNSIYWNQQEGGHWRFVERLENGELKKFQIDLEQEYHISEDNFIYYKVGSNYLSENKIFRCSLSDGSCSPHTQSIGDEVMVKNRYLSSWDLKNNNIFYSIYDPVNLEYTMYQFPLPSGQAEELFKLSRDIYFIAGQLSMSAKEQAAYYTKKQEMSFDIIIMSASE